MACHHPNRMSPVLVTWAVGPAWLWHTFIPRAWFSGQFKQILIFTSLKEHSWLGASAVCLNQLWSRWLRWADLAKFRLLKIQKCSGGSVCPYVLCIRNTVLSHADLCMTHCSAFKFLIFWGVPVPMVGQKLGVTMGEEKGRWPFSSSLQLN